MMSLNIAEMIATALEAHDFGLAKLLLCRECGFTWNPTIKRNLAESDDPRIRVISRWVGKPWVNIRTPKRIIQGPEQIYEDLYGLPAAVIFSEPGIILHEDLMEFAGVMLPAMSGAKFHVACRDVAGNILIERIHGRIIHSHRGVNEPMYRCMVEVVDVIPKGSDLQKLKAAKGQYTVSAEDGACRRCIVGGMAQSSMAGF